MKRFITMTLLPLTLAGGIAGAAWAATNQAGETSDAAEIQALQASSLSLGEAITSVEGQVTGTLMSVAWEQDDASNAWGYEVEVADASGTTVQSYFVDASSGAITEMAPDMDHQDDGDADGETDDD